MSILKNIFYGISNPSDLLGYNTSSEYEQLYQELHALQKQLRGFGVSGELIEKLENKENAIMALEMERMFLFAVEYGAHLQRELIL